MATPLLNSLDVMRLGLAKSCARSMKMDFSQSGKNRYNFHRCMLLEDQSIYVGHRQVIYYNPTTIIAILSWIFPTSCWTLICGYSCVSCS